MENSENLLAILNLANSHYSRHTNVDAVNRAIAFIGNAKVRVKKISISKKPPNSWSRYSSLHRRGLWGYPKVILDNGTIEIEMKHKYAVSPYLTTYQHTPLPTGDSAMQTFELDRSCFAVPSIVTEANFSGKNPITIAVNQYGTEAAGEWMINNVPRLLELDQLVQDAWDRQVSDFEKEADRYMAKLGGRQRDNFQKKLVKELSKSRSQLEGMSAADMYKMFRFARDNFEALSNILNFCRRNRADAAFIDESDMEAAMKMAEINKIMDQ